MKSSKIEKKETSPFSDDDMYFYNFETMTGFVVRNGPTPETQAAARLFHFFSDLLALKNDQVMEIFVKHGVEDVRIIRKEQGDETVD